MELELFQGCGHSIPSAPDWCACVMFAGRSSIHKTASPVAVIRAMWSNFDIRVLCTPGRVEGAMSMPSIKEPKCLRAHSAECGAEINGVAVNRM